MLTLDHRPCRCLYYRRAYPRRPRRTFSPGPVHHAKRPSPSAQPYAFTGSSTWANFLPVRALYASLWNAYPAISGNAIVASANTICS